MIVREYWDSDSLYLGIFRYPVIEEETLNPIHGVMAEEETLNPIHGVMAEEETLNPIHGVMAEVPIVNDPPTPTSVSGIKMLQNYNYEIVVFFFLL